MNVLYIHVVGPWGGSSRSLYETIKNFPDKSVNPYFLTVKGTSEFFFRNISKNLISVKGLSRFDNTQYSFYRGFRWLVVLRELYYLPLTILSIYRSKKKFKKIDIIHINDFVAIFPLVLAKVIFKVPIVVHVRSVSRLNFKSFRTRLITRILKSFANQIICIDETVKESLDSKLESIVIHNSFTKSNVIDNDINLAQKISQLDSKIFKIGFIGSMHKSKGILELFEAFKIVISRGYLSKLIYVGGEPTNSSNTLNRILNKLGIRQFQLEDLKTQIKASNFENHVSFFGHVNNVENVYDVLDIVCIPGLADAPGRQLIEAAFSKVPVILAISKPKKDTIISYKTGIAVPLRNAEKLSEAIIFCINNKEKTKKMGENAFDLAKKNFDPKTNSLKILNIYEKISSTLNDE